MLTLRELRKILISFDCREDSSRGKGSHTTFFRQLGEATYSCPVPNRKEVLQCYVRGARRKVSTDP